jgi:hypothetical protein
MIDFYLIHMRADLIKDNLADFALISRDSAGVSQPF